MIGKTIYGYTLQRLLGVGGMAEVWLAENEIGKLAAVKLLLPKFCHDEDIVTRFKNEAKVMVKLDHPNIRQVYDYGEIDGRPGIVMEYLEGDDLKTLMKSGRCFSDSELHKWWNQIADALNYTHAQGIVHRDIKPSNIFLDKKGNIKLLDFGIAKIKEGISMTQTGAMMGTLIYMSPEQVRDSKHIGSKSDIYSLAVSFVHLLTGKKPYDNHTISDYDIRKGIVEIPLDLSLVPVEWRNFLKPYLEKDPDKRPDLRHFEALKQINTIRVEEDEGTIVTSVVKPESMPAKKTQGRKKVWIGIGIGIVILMMLVIVVLILGSSEPIPNPAVAVLDEENEILDTSDAVLGELPPKVEEKLAQDLTFTINGVPLVMKLVEGGTFEMGSNDKDACKDEKPVHSVTLDSFYIGETEVTNVIFKTIMGYKDEYAYGLEYPVTVMWEEGEIFCERLSQITGFTFRLPTEAEWEFAARGGKNSNNYQYSGSNNINEVAWYSSNSGDKDRPVKKKAPNELGLYDMSGNVWEWCEDRYDSKYYESSPKDNPKGSSTAPYRVVRGGSAINSSAKKCRVSFRNYGSTGEYNGNWIGFRVVMVVDKAMPTKELEFHYTPPKPKYNSVTEGEKPILLY